MVHLKNKHGHWPTEVSTLCISIDAHKQICIDIYMFILFVSAQPYADICNLLIHSFHRYILSWVRQQNPDPSCHHRACNLAGETDINQSHKCDSGAVLAAAPAQWQLQIGSTQPFLGKGKGFLHTSCHPSRHQDPLPYILGVTACAGPQKRGM